MHQACHYFLTFPVKIRLKVTRLNYVCWILRSKILFRYQDIQAGRIPSSVAANLKAIIREANATQKEIRNIESRNEAKGTDYEMDQNDFAHLFKLHKHMEKLKAQFELLKNPVLRFDTNYNA